jgi:hypothetical protein
MIVYYLFVYKKICLEEKSLNYFHKKFKIKKKPVLVGFLGGFFWVFWGGFFNANPACMPQCKSRVQVSAWHLYGGQNHGDRIGA